MAQRFVHKKRMGSLLFPDHLSLSINPAHISSNGACSKHALCREPLLQFGFVCLFAFWFGGGRRGSVSHVLFTEPQVLVGLVA